MVLKKRRAFKTSWIKRILFALLLIVILPLRPEDYQAISEDEAGRA